MVAQISLSLVLISGAALFARSLWNLRHQDFGMNRDAMLVPVPLEFSRQAIARQTALAWPLYERMNTLAGIRSAAVSACGPMDSVTRTISVASPSRPAQHGDLARLVNVSPRYFETIGIPILAGRGITPDDRAGAPSAVVLSQAAARALFPGQEPIGRFVSQGDRYDAKTALKVVGVARDVRFSGAREPFGFVLYVPLAAAALLCAAALAASYFPARRAASLDPVAALC